MPLAVELATLGGVGRIRFAPGTWGSAVGLLLAAVVGRLAPQALLPAVALAAIAASVPVCAAAERALGRHDPPAIVLDEAVGMAAILWCVPWLASSWVLLAAAFLVFRALDIAKPPPLRALARLPGGWGIVADDVGAACYTCFALWLLTLLTK